MCADNAKRIADLVALASLCSPFIFAPTPAARRDGRVAEGARLESVYTGNRIVGSNPTPSARTQILRNLKTSIKVNYFTRLGAILALFTVRNSLVQSMNKTWVRTWVQMSVDGGIPGIPGYSSSLTARGR
jgi:hypothetical protein